MANQTVSVLASCESCGKQVHSRGGYPNPHLALNSDEWCMGVDRSDSDTPPPAPNLPLLMNRPGV